MAAKGSVANFIGNELRMTAQVLIQQLENAARVDALPADEYPLFERIEEMDDVTCDLCLQMDGVIVSRDDPDFDQMHNPFHINCRGILAGISKDEVGPDGDPLEPDYERPDPDLLEEFGHFFMDKRRYAPLRVPAHPEGRDFIARPYVDEDGIRRVKIDWRIEPYELS